MYGGLYWPNLRYSKIDYTVPYKTVGGVIKESQTDT